MSKISQKNRNRLAGEAIAVLKDHHPIPLSTRQIAGELVRDKEFCLKLLLFLRDRGYVKQSQKKGGADYARWYKWTLSDDSRERFL